MSKTNGSFLPVTAIREHVVAYLGEHSLGRQGDIAKACGVTRSTLNHYSTGEREITDVAILARLQAWVERDRVSREA